MLSAGCAAGEEGVGQQVEGIAIAGPWVAPATTRDIARTQRVSVVDPPTVAPAGRCTSSNPFACSCTHPACTPAHPGTNDLRAYLLRRFTRIRNGGSYCCRQNSAALGSLSVHAIGRAMDLMVPMTGGDADNTIGDEVANWLVENANFIGIQRVVWDRAYWNGERGFGLLSSSSLPHTDHLHVELSIAGGARQTPFFTSGASMGSGTCTPRCNGTDLIAANCTITHCGLVGAPCLAGPPPSCGTPPPPEPPEAVLVPGAALPAVARLGAVGRVRWLTPQRMFDTRTAAESTRLTRGGGATSGPVLAAQGAVYRNWTGAGLPADASTVWINNTAVPSTLGGFLSVIGTGQARPETSNLNWAPMRVAANAAVVSLGDSQGISFAPNTDVELISDVYAAFAPTGDNLTAAGPLRVYDTRSASMPLLPNTPRAIDVRAPATATGVIANIAVIAGAADGFVVLYPCGMPVPGTSSVNFTAQRVVSNSVMVQLGTDRQICARSTSEVGLIVDVSGYLSPTGLSAYQPLRPVRMLDTRSGTTRYRNRLAARQTLELPIQSMPGMPANVHAVVANITAVNTADNGFVTAYPCGGGATAPGTSSLNYGASDVVSGLVVSPVTNGSLCLFSLVRTDLIVDLQGVWTGAMPAPPTMMMMGEDPGDPPDLSNDGGLDDASGPTPMDAAGADTGTAEDASSPPLRDASPDARRGSEPLEAPSGCGCRTVNHAGDRSCSLLAFGAFATLMAAQRRRRRTH